MSGSSENVAVVAGAGGFIGGHLVASLLESGAPVRAVDIKPLDEWFQVHSEASNQVADLRNKSASFDVLDGADTVYNLAADMGGMGFIENNKALCMLSVLINTHLLMAAERHNLSRYFYASSACVYAAEHQLTTEAVPLREADAYPAMPEDGYGWEKLFSERMCRHFLEDFGLETRVARYHNVYGPYGSWEGGREKVPAALCRKIGTAALTGNHEIEIWGDGEQTRTFMYIDDCTTGTLKITASEVSEPLNLGRAEVVSINQLADVISDIAGITVTRKNLSAEPQGVRGRSSENTEIRRHLGWEPSIGLHEGLETTYRWIYDQLVRST
ncbi:MAG: NAD-dependent epimerase/dehydratase family protein [Acidimicrobiia bacterium]